MADHTETEHLGNMKRIAKNTLFLYGRMIIMMCVSLFTFRELLKQLGIDDYGIYNVVGGIVILFSFLSNAMTQSNQRYLSYHLGEGNITEFKKTFSMILNIQVMIGIIVILLAETLGLWFINSKMNFPPESMTAVNWVYQFSILTFLIQLFQIPYTSAIIAHEKMSFFSYFSIGEAVLKLGVVLLLGVFAAKRLIIYSGLISLCAIIILAIYIIYCNVSFKECKYHYSFEKTRFIKLTSFSGWNMLGGMGVAGVGQGINILFNIFCGVAVNAAMGISHQVSAAVGALVGNMQMAFNPQIVKSYAAKDIPFFNSLIFRASRISFFLILIVGLPVIFCTTPLLKLWLTDVPDYAASFAQLSILYCMIDALSGSLWVAVQAVGKIKWYTIILTILFILNLPIDWILLKKGFSPNLVLLTRAVICLIMHICRVFYLQRIADFSAWTFIKSVTLKSILTIFFCIPIPLLLTVTLSSNMQFLILPITLLETFIIGSYYLLTKGERNFIHDKLHIIYRKFNTKAK